MGLKNVYFHILNIAIFMLNILIDDHHLSNITKLGKKKNIGWTYGTCVNIKQV
jgi:hypothetical protein